jgi:hypothetical protein
MLGRLVRSLWLLMGAACVSGTDPQIRPCTAAGTAVDLAAGEYVSIDPTPDSGCSVFPAAAGAAEYLIVPQLATGTSGATAGFRLFGDTILPASPAPHTSAPRSLAALSAPERFHAFLRLGDERRAWGFEPLGDEPASPRIPTSPAADPPTYNQLRTFQVCATLSCTRFDRVGARARAVKTKVAIFVDTLAPAGGLDSTALDSIASLFDTRLYGLDTAAFGVESDIDSNTVVLVLMTNTVNKLVTKKDCEAGEGFVAGFFFGVDLDPRFRNDSRSNKAEIFYTFVPDPAATLSCAHSSAEVQAFVPVTLIHEFQHMISFNQHVLLRGSVNGEVLWLNEGLSHYAEELGGRSYELSPDGKVLDCTLGTVECRFYSGNLQNAYNYMDTTSRYFLLPAEGIGSLTERGAAWLFVRYIIDRYAAGNTLANWNTFTRSLVQTAQTGAQNVATVTGAPFSDAVTGWALANYVTDDVGAPAELQYESWGLHAVYSSLHTQRSNIFPKFYPLEPASSLGREVNLGGTLRAGSGIYQLATQNPGDPGFTLSFTLPSGGLINSSLTPRLNVIRLQ